MAFGVPLSGQWNRDGDRRIRRTWIGNPLIFNIPAAWRGFILKVRGTRSIIKIIKNGSPAIIWKSGEECTADTWSFIWLNRQVSSTWGIMDNRKVYSIFLFICVPRCIEAFRNNDPSPFVPSRGTQQGAKGVPERWFGTRILDSQKDAINDGSYYQPNYPTSNNEFIFDDNAGRDRTSTWRDSQYNYRDCGGLA